MKTLILLLLTLHRSYGWSVSLTNTDQTFDEFESVARDTSGNVYAAGYTYGSVDGQPYAGSSDGMLVKYSPDGMLVWLLQFGQVSLSKSLLIWLIGGTDDEFAEAVHVYFSGSTRSYDLPSALEPVGSDNVMFVAFCPLDSPSFANMHTYVLPAAVKHDTFDLDVDSINGLVYVTGRFYQATSEYSPQAFILQLDSNLLPIWNHTFQDSSQHWGQSVRADIARGTVYLFGSVLSPPFQGLPVPTDGAAFLAQYDRITGNQLWVKLAGDGAGSVVRFETTGRLYLAGSFNGTWDNQTSAGFDVFVAQLSSVGDGSFDWVQLSGAEGDNYGAYAVASDTAILVLSSDPIARLFRVTTDDQQIASAPIANPPTFVYQITVDPSGDPIAAVGSNFGDQLTASIFENFYFIPAPAVSSSASIASTSSASASGTDHDAGATLSSASLRPLPSLVLILVCALFGPLFVVTINLQLDPGQSR